MGKLDPTFVSDAIDLVRDVIDKIFPDKTAQAQQRAEALQHGIDVAQEKWRLTLQAATQSDAQQSEIQKVDQASASFWKSGARPMVLWVCALSLASDFLARPYIHAFAHLELPPLDMQTLLFLTCSLLGIGTMRSFDKLKGTA